MARTRWHTQGVYRVSGVHALCTHRTCTVGWSEAGRGIFVVNGSSRGDGLCGEGDAMVSEKGIR